MLLQVLQSSDASPRKRDTSETPPNKAKMEQHNNENGVCHGASTTFCDISKPARQKLTSDSTVSASLQPPPTKQDSRRGRSPLRDLRQRHEHKSTNYDAASFPLHRQHSEAQTLEPTRASAETQNTSRASWRGRSCECSRASTLTTGQWLCPCFGCCGREESDFESGEQREDCEQCFE